MPESNKNVVNRVIRTPLTFSRFMLLIFLAGFSATGWMRVSQALFDQAWIERFLLVPSAAYFIISGAVWGLLFLAALLAVLLQLKGSGWFTIGVALFISAWRWFERLAFAQSPLVNSGWIFEVILNVALLLILLFMMKGFPPTTPSE